MKRNKLEWVVRFALCILLVMLAFSCARKPSVASIGTEVVTTSGILPKGALLLEDYGSGWVKFSLDGEVFLFHKTTVGAYQGFESLAHIR